MSTFLSFIWKSFKVLASSRKFQVAVLSAIVWAIGKIGLDVTAADLLPIVGPLWLYVFGVALEDMGKAKAQADAVRAIASSGDVKKTD